MKARKVCIQAGGSLNAEDWPYNQLCWEMGRRIADWRMRSPSEEGRDNITRPERGPLGPGGPVNRSRARPLRRGLLAAAAGPKVGANEVWLRAAVRDRTSRSQGADFGRLHTELRGAWRLKPYRGKPDVRNFREGGWKRDPWRN
jgi:hypothetical protein